MTVTVTGGSGVVGAAVIRHLVETGQEVRAVARSGSAERAVASLGATPVRADVLNHTAMVAAARGSDVVYHVAGVNELCPVDPAGMYRVNVDGTRTVLRACRAADVRRLVYTSSAVTMGEEAGEVATEETAHRGWYLSDYERSKHHAERAVLTEAAGVEVVAVNPSSVQGPGRATGTGKIILDVVRGTLPALVESHISIVDIDDCARGHLLAAEHGVAGDRYLLSGFTTTVSAALEAAASVLGRELNVRMLPHWLVRAGAAVAETASRLVGWKPPVCAEMVRVMSHGHRYDGSRASRSLGLVYTPAARTIERLVRWFQTEGLIEP